MVFKRLRAILGTNDAAPAIVPDERVARTAEGSALLAAGRLDPAIAAFRAALKLGAGNDARLPLGFALWRSGRFEEACECLRTAVDVDGRCADAHHLLALALRDRGELVPAARHFSATIEIDPGLVEAHLHLVDVLAGSASEQAASEAASRGLEACRAALERAPADPQLHHSAGLFLRALGRREEAIASYGRALAARPAFPEALSNRGLVLQDLGRYDDALADHDAALRIDPQLANAHGNRANVLRELLRHEEALASYERAHALAPGLESLYLNESLSRLVLGDLRGGWPRYEWRWQGSGSADPRKAFAQPMWLGREPLQGKTIFLHAEQGLGDTIQFCRYAREVADRGAKVLLGVQPALEPVLAGLDGVDRLLTPANELPPFDFHCPLLSLPLAFATSLESIPNRGPYVRPSGEAFAAKAEAWEERLGPRRGPRVGIVWSGNANHRNDRNRSIPLTALLREALPAGRFVAVQKELRPGDAALLEGLPGTLQAAPWLGDFGNTAALLSRLDLLISVDTSVAHLAAAMGKPVWLLLPFNPDWRWLLDREDSPWYDSMRLFRQTRLGDWSAPLAAVRAELARFLG